MPAVRDSSTTSSALSSMGRVGPPSEPAPAAAGSRRVRTSGVLLHPTSLPGPYGIGDLGTAAYTWVEALAYARQKWWQVLPLGPTGYGDSPYQCFSAFAGNAYLVGPDLLVEDGLVSQADLAGIDLPHDRVDFGRVIDFKIKVLARAWDNFQSNGSADLRQRFAEFCAEEASWLDDYALFMALKDAHGGTSWLEWEAEWVLREPSALARARRQLEAGIAQHKFRQFLFFRQWRGLKEYANAKGLRLIGDIPIFVSSDSADVWAHPELFQLDERRRLKAVAGVPPDYFSRTGQLWGNPLYDWQALKATGYAWWVERLRATLKEVDVVRLDHFRGFEAYWEIPAGMPTAEIGRWVQGPGADLLDAVQAALAPPDSHGRHVDEELLLGSATLPIIAEDLGVITPEVTALRERFGLPGMRILQFAFGGAPEDRFLPHNFEPDTAVYTGTHDNDTTRGWFEAATESERDFCRRYLGCEGQEISWDLIRLAWSSVADLALTPLQDVMALGSEARMNLPGRASGNWTWRYRAEMLTSAALDRLGALTELYGRCERPKPARPAAQLSPG